MKSILRENGAAIKLKTLLFGAQMIAEYPGQI